MTGKKLENEDIMSTLASAFNLEYSLTVSVAMGELEKDVTKDVDLNEIEKDIHREWRVKYQHGLDQSETPEVGLINQDASNKVCYRCKEKGHMAYQYPKRNNKKKSNKNVTCNNCGKIGHAADNCWKDPKNASKLPEWYRKKLIKKNKAAIESNYAGIKILLCAVNGVMVT